MIEIDKDALVTACEDEDVTVHIKYSGRGMYGKQCIAVSGTGADLMRFALRVLPAIEAVTTDEASSTTWSLLDSEWGNMNWDNFGSDMIFYWPEVRAV